MCGFPAYGSHLGCVTARRVTPPVCAPAPVTRCAGSAPGARGAGTHSPWPLPFAPPAPQRIAPPCSPASPLLRQGLTSHARASSASALRLPDADQNGLSPVVRRETSRFRRDPFARDGVFDHGRASTPRIAAPHILPSATVTASASTDFGFSRLNSPPHAIAVYASRRSSPSAPQHSLPSARYGLLGPDFHRLDRASFAWRTTVNPTHAGIKASAAAVEHSAPVICGCPLAAAMTKDRTPWELFFGPDSPASD